MTPVQARMARAALALSQEEVASKSSLPRSSIAALEAGPGEASSAARLRATLEAAGVEFLGDDGVRLRGGAKAGGQTVALEQLNSANDE